MDDVVAVCLNTDFEKMSSPSPANALERKNLTYETKFLVDETAAEAALAWARQHLIIDPHVKSSKDIYSVTSVYLDTRALHTYQRNGSYARSKFRVRRYGDERAVFLERKMKTRGIVGKQRVKVAEHEVDLLAEMAADPDWIGFWFHRRILLRRVVPQCQIAYDRVARVGESAEGPIRFTLDRNVRAWETEKWTFCGLDGGMPVLKGHAILELKYQRSLPAAFKQLISDLGIKAQSVSKYRLSISALGLAERHGLVKKPKPDGSKVAPQDADGDPDLD